MEVPRIISLELSTSGRFDSHFRILAEGGVKYVTVQAGALDTKSLSNIPLGFQDILPALLYSKGNWNTAFVRRDAASDKLEVEVSKKKLPGVQKLWHDKKINFLDLQRTEQLSLLAQESSWKAESSIKEHGQSIMIAKIARFHWEIPYVDTETHIYCLLESTGIAPRFLGHIYEDERVIGLLLEKVAGRHAGISDLKSCQEALKHLHGLGIIHGDVNRYNFIIDENDKVYLIDFEKATLSADTTAMEEEMSSLEEELTEVSGRGGGF